MTVALRSLRVTADLGTTGYVRGAQPKVTADKQMADSRAVGIPSSGFFIGSVSKLGVEAAKKSYGLALDVNRHPVKVSWKHIE